MSTLIREATEEDLASVLALYADPELNAGDTLSEQEARTMFAHFKAYPSYRLFVLCEKGERTSVLGSYALLIMHNMVHRGAPAAIVESMVVRADRRGRGLGKRMMTHAMSQAREAGCYKLALSSNQKRERAHAFYESLGFKRHGFSFTVEI